MVWFQDWQFFLDGFLYTLYISFLGLLLTLLIGIAVGIALSGGKKWLKGICRAYMSFFQNTPLMIQVFVFYNILPKVGIRLDVTAIGILSLSLYTGAYAADIVDSSLRAVPLGQAEAATSQGFSRMQVLFRVVLPQAVKVGLPAMTNQAVNLIKNSSVMAAIAGGELMYRTNSWSGSNLVYGPAFVMAGALYLSICFPVSMLARHLEKRSVKGV